MYFRDDNTKTWLPITWNESARQVRLIGKALISMDVKRRRPRRYFSQNMYEIIIADFANFRQKQHLFHYMQHQLLLKLNIL